MISITYYKINEYFSALSYLPMTTTNSTTLPAYFVLKLNKPQPICLELVKHINTITELECCDTSTSYPLFSLITQHFSNGKMDSSLNKGLFVNLPDQVHCYFMTECKGLDGVVVSSIPFTHPSHVPQILAVLRQQAIFNTLVNSVIRPHSKQDVENMIMLEVSALSCRHLSVSFEHPLQESMSTIEIDLTDISAVKAKLYSTATETNLRTSSEHISKILQRCLSIPVTMRYLIRTLQNQQMDMTFTSINNGSFSSAPNGGLGGNNDRGLDTSKIKQEPGMSNGLSGRSSTLKSLINDDFSSFSTTVIDSNIQKTNIINLVSEPHKKKRKTEKHWKPAKQKPVEDCEVLLESSSNDSVSMGTPMEVDVDPEYLTHDKDSSEVGDPDETDEILKITAAANRLEPKLKKCKEVKKSPSRSSLIMDLAEGKSLVPPSVTITPITSNTPNINSVLERRPGIEIFPISNTTPSNIATSITITPISGSGDKDERKNFKNRNLEDKFREKKRKRRKDEDGGTKMGPPGKVPAKSDPLSKPVSVSIIKPATDSPPTMNRPNSPSIRKYSPSPTHFREKSTGSSIQPSPKHSPAYGSSPKHSPKHGTTSPKQPSGSSGKPSMSTLKSASSSPNSSKTESKVKSSSSSGSSKDSRDRDASRKGSGTASSSSSGSPKIKSSSVKLKQLEITSEVTATSTSSNALPTNSASIDPKNAGNALQRNRKGSLSAVIDKLKSAQEVGDPIISGGISASSSSPANLSKREGVASGASKEGKIPTNPSASSATKISGLESKTSQIQKVPDGVKNPAEYMVKQSSEGIKLLINKKSKESSKVSKNGSCSGTGSPKTHTGLKPGVVSGPASKKPTSSKSSCITAVSSKLPSSVSKSSGIKASTSMSKSVSKNTGSPKMSSSGATDLSRKESVGKSRTLKTGMEKGIFKEGVRKGSPAPSRDEDHERVKTLKLDSGLPASLVVEGLMKPFDTKFQIPKLSARNNNNTSSTSGHFDSSNITALGSDGSENNNNNGNNNCSNSGNNSACSTGNSSSASSNSGKNNNNNNNNIKSSAEKLLEKSDVKIVELPAHKASLDIAANLKYTSKHDSDCMAKVPSTGVPNLLPLPMGLANVSPKLPMTSPNLPTTSLSSITSKLDRGDDSPGVMLNEKNEPEMKSSTIDGSSVKFQSASSVKAEELKRPELSKHVITSSQQSPDILDFSSSVNLPGKLNIPEKGEKSLIGSTPACFIKPHSPALFGKSPGQSPVNLPSHSPQSIIDDDLMDEALLLRK
ncbi:UNVERIFIED_CONTAM: hypothetical protein PYX00_010677 [Menopon gallinae]|uniref:Mediator of RNA polymerase II transcription subunit 1 n=1 Tax=Menopon gallinae TaxID=328185 RepID=A0AAW2HGP3_9NEOP